MFLCFFLNGQKGLNFFAMCWSTLFVVKIGSNVFVLSNLSGCLRKFRANNVLEIEDIVMFNY